MVYILVQKKGKSVEMCAKKVVHDPICYHTENIDSERYVPLCIPKSLKVTPRRLLAPRVLIDLRASRRGVLRDRASIVTVREAQRTTRTIIGRPPPVDISCQLHQECQIPHRHFLDVTAAQILTSRAFQQEASGIVGSLQGAAGSRSVAQVGAPGP